MGYPRITSVAVSFSFLFLLTPNAAFGQRLGGGRPVGNLGGAVRASGGNVAAPAVRSGPQVRPVPLRVAPRAAVNNVVRPSQPGFAGVGLGDAYRSRSGTLHQGHRLTLRGAGFDPLGFEQHHFGFFFDKFAFFGGFPFFPSFAPSDPFALDRVGLFRVPQRHLGVPGIERRRVRFFHHHPFPFGGFFGWIPYFDSSTGPEYSYTSPDGTGNISQGQQLELKAIAEGLADSLEVERVSTTDLVPRSVLRLTWRNSDLPAAQVALFLADSSQSVLSAQTLRSPPFTALFEPHPATAFVGLTVVWPDGTLSTRFVRYKR